MNKQQKQTKKESTTKEEDVNLAELSELSGEKDIKQAPRYPLPSLKMNGKIGKFYRTNLKSGELVVGEDGKAELTEVANPSGVILKVRKMFTADEADYQLYSNEVGSGRNEQISVFDKREMAEKTSVNFIFQGTAKEIKVRFPELSMTQIIYFLLEESGEIVRLKVKGMSLGCLFEYWREFSASEHLFEFVTELGSKADKNKFGKFFVNTFKKGKRVESLAVVAKAMKEVCEKLTEIEDFYKDKIYEVAEEETTVKETIVPVGEDGKPEAEDTPEEKSRIPWKETPEPTEKELTDMFGRVE